jgi:xanthine dehydrogenase iron-sulfur cluster and FAD-binding subunit A
MSALFDCLNSDSKDCAPEKETLLSDDESRASRAMSRDDTIPALLVLLQQNQQQKQQSIQDIPWSSTLKFYLNGSTIELHNPNPTTLLAHYIRDSAGLRGTKLGCEEGGCGACTVALTKKEGGTRSVNSCLRPLCANDGMGIMTVEGIGSVKSGLSIEQQSIVENNATQCGFCTPGWVTNMHALNESTSEHQHQHQTASMSEKEVEDYFDGNLCRCTGYRPIMKAAFRATAACPSACPGKQSGTPCHHGVGPLDSGCGGNQSSSSSSSVMAIEDLVGTATATTGAGATGAAATATGAVSSKDKAKCTTLGARRNKELVSQHQAQPLRFQDPVSGSLWYRPVTFEQLCTVMRDSTTADPLAQIQFIGGNTSTGVTKYLNQSAPYNTADAYDVFVDINHIPELQQESYDAATRQLTVGSSKTLSELIAMLKQHSTSTSTSTAPPSEPQGGGVDHSSVFSVTAHHLSLIANTQVRNAGSWAGNLGIFNRHQDFPSDAVLALTLAQATLTVSDLAGQVSSLSMDQFLQLPPGVFLSQRAAEVTPLTPEGCLILLSVTVQESQPASPGGRSLVSESYKICVREHNAHAQVNAGFSFVLEAPSRERKGEEEDFQHARVNIGHGQLARRRPATAAAAAAAAAAPVCLSARIVYGGVSNKTFIAVRTQHVFSHATLSSSLLQQALVALSLDLADEGAGGGGPSRGFGDPADRLSVMQTCLYRAVLRCYGRDNLPANLQSVLEPFMKPPSSGGCSN